MDMVPLQASARTTKEKAGALRRAQRVPCVLYGNKTENTLLHCEEKSVRRAYQKAGESTLVELDLDGRKIPVLIHALAADPVTDRIAHVDFYAVDMTKEVETHVPIRLDGESLAIKELGAILVTPLAHVRIRCLPARLPHELVASLTSLQNFHDSLTVANLRAPEGVTILDDPTNVIATVQEPRAEEVAPPPATEAEAGAAPTEGAAAEGTEPAATPAGEKTEA
ncbi:MAG: 50S ribosomal protein L25 [Candidatus Peregrinibacteria bacterium Gr01-1014_25]|nr:MAG: 50S ribosomal protein L25 [Candidatus Peregrinibacteria bacterium Gr01-1014_25]